MVFKRSKTLQRSILKSSDAKMKSHESSKESSACFTESEVKEDSEMKELEEVITVFESVSEHTKNMQARERRVQRIEGRLETVNSSKLKA